MSEITDIHLWRSEKLAEALDVLLEADEEDLIEVLTMKGADLWTASELVDLVNRMQAEIGKRVEAARRAVEAVN